MSDAKSGESKVGANPPAEPMPEGKEPPPKGVRAAAIVRWLILLAIAGLAAKTIWTYWGPGAHSAGSASHAEDRYYCPMHPQIRSPDPGECPICHMTLELIPEDRRHAEGSAATQASGIIGDASPPPNATSTMTLDHDATSPTGGIAHDSRPRGVVPIAVAPERQRLAEIAVVPVTRRTIGDTLRVPGVVEAPQNAISQVHVRAPGFLERLAVRSTGVRVSQGEPLAWVYSPQIYQVQQELLTARRWTSAADAPDSSPASPSDIDLAARRNLELLGMAASDIESVLRTHTPMRAIPIRAPASGFVTQRAAVLGLYAQPETVLYEIADLSRIWVIASVFERDLPRIQRGTPVRFISTDTPDAPLAARVALIEPEVSTSTRTARVRLEIANPQMRLRPGQFGDVVFDLPQTSALLVPRDAVIDTGEQTYVYVDAGGGHFEPRRVQAGPLHGGDIEIVEGLREGERIVTRGNFMLDSESRLESSLSEGAQDARGASPGAGTGSSETGPNCDTDFDRTRFPDRYVQCRACERVHAGMGSMEADCKNAIAQPWR